MVMGRMGVEPILPIKQPITIGTMLNFDGDSVGVCKQNLTLDFISTIHTFCQYQHWH